MKYLKIKKLKNKLYFNISDIADIFNIRMSSARIMCNRYAKKGIFLRLKNNFYVLSDNWEICSWEELFRISNFLQVPSYISYMSALMNYGVTTQVQQNYVEACTLKRTKDMPKSIF
jgi:predicted transcriptional regulator of viral defense system